MRESEYRALSNEEKAALAAEHVMGECVHSWKWTGPNTWDLTCTECGQGHGSLGVTAPRVGKGTRYLEDIAAAWQVVERLKASGYDVTVSVDSHPMGVYACEVAKPEWTGSEYWNAPTAPEAICLTALAAVGVIEG